MTEAKAREIVYVRSGLICEVCSSARATNWHHRIARSQGGKWDPANGLHTCGSGTTGCHGWITANPDEAKARGLALHPNEDPETVPVFSPLWQRMVLLRSDGSLEFAA